MRRKTRNEPDNKEWQYRELVQITAADEGCEPADLYRLTKGRRDLFGPDGLHPSPAGAAAIAEEIGKVLIEKKR